MAERGCWYCRNESEPGWVETDNNGPVVRCPICERRKEVPPPSPCGEV